MATLTKIYSTRDAAEVLNVVDSRVRQICIASDGGIGRKFNGDWMLNDSDIELIRQKLRPVKKTGTDD